MTLDQAARRYIGVPWRHLGRARAGLDCIGLVLLAARDCGIATDDPAPYAREPSSHRLRAGLAAALDEVPLAEAHAGDVLVFNLGLYAGHLGVLGAHPAYRVASVIHAYAPRRRVVEEPLATIDAGTLTGAFRLRSGPGPHRASAMGAR
ncbi:C40 family peptidase [Elioraea sp.]|uniref:C40 family peptidase n=1 Tax=Elioraea sp. TaxID=2185103 RepID=UPI003F7209B0